MPPRRLSILGVGLLGGSIGLGIKARLKDVQIVGYGHRPESLATARSLGAIDIACGDPAQAVAGADLVIVCTPVGVFPRLLAAIAPALSREAVVTDVGSTKQSIVELAGRLLPEPARFVGSHPMAGSEKRGVEFAQPDLFVNATCIVTPTDATASSSLEMVEDLWRLLGMKTVRLSPAEHDRQVAQISHLPHAVACLLRDAADDSARRLAGRGFADMTRIAAGDPGLWRDIFLDNRENVRACIDDLKRRLDAFSQLLDSQDAETLYCYLDRIANPDRDR